MKSTIEYNGVPLVIQPENFKLLPREGSYSVCAWCDEDKAITKELNRLGIAVSHGVCEACREKWLRK